MPNLLTPAFGAGGFSATQTVSVNFGSNANRALIGHVFFDKGFEPNVGNVTSVVIDPTGANIACTIGARRSGSTVIGQAGFVQSFSAVGAIPTGIRDVVVTANTGDGKPRVWCQPLDDTTSIGAEVTATGLSLSPSAVVASATGSKVYALVSGSMVDSQVFTATAPATQATRVTEANCAGFAGAIWREDGATSVTIDGAYTGSTAQWAITAFSAAGGGDSTPPTLTSPSGTGGTQNCSGSVSTNEGNGTLYAVATGSVTAPTGIQVEAGQDHTGAGAERVVSQAVSGTGAQTIASGAVTAGTRYLHFMHNDAAGNRSAVVSSASFVVAASGDTTPPTLSSPTGSGGSLVCSGSVSTNEGNGTLYAVVTSSSTAPTGAQVESGQDHTGVGALRAVNQAVSGTGAQTIASGVMTAGTRFLHYAHKDAAGNRSAVVSSASFTVTGPATYGMTFGPFALNTGAGQRAPGESFDWWAFHNVVIGGNIDSATRMRGSGTLNISGLAAISGLPFAGSWEVQLRFPGDAEPEKGTMRDTLTAA